jgi:hypothetical protein
VFVCVCVCVFVCVCACVRAYAAAWAWAWAWACVCMQSSRGAPVLARHWQTPLPPLLVLWPTSAHTRTHTRRTHARAPCTHPTALVLGVGLAGERRAASRSRGRVAHLAADGVGPSGRPACDRRSKHHGSGPCAIRPRRRSDRPFFCKARCCPQARAALIVCTRRRRARLDVSARSRVAFVVAVSPPASPTRRSESPKRG